MNSFQNHSIIRGDTRPLKFNYINKLFEQIAEENKDDVALIYEDSEETKTLSYKEVNSITNKLAQALNALITRKQLSCNEDGDYLVAVSMLPSEKLILVLLAILKSGAAYLPLDFRFTQSTLEHILSEARPALIICENDFNVSNRTKISFDELLKESNNILEGSSNDEFCLKINSNNLAIVLYTSGSTGVPKGVRLSHNVIFNRLQWQFRTFPYSSSEKVTVFKTALTFGDSICEIWAPLVSGKSLLIIPQKITQNPEYLVKYLDKYKIERLVLVPSLLKSLLLYLNLQKNTRRLQNLKTWVCSGESLPVSLVNEFFQYFPEREYILCNFYGSTEVMADVTYYVIKHFQQLQNFKNVPIGLPIDNTITYLLDNNLQPVKKGAVGQMWVSGLNLAAGYVKNRNSDRFIINPHSTDPLFRILYNTGDYARIADGILMYEGRTDNQVKVRGHKVDLSEIEKAVLSLPVTEKTVVLCYHPGLEDQAVLAFIILKSNCNLNEVQVEAMLRDKLTSYMWPQVIILETIPLLFNGKIDRQTLLRNYEKLNNDENLLIDYSGISNNDLPLGKVLLGTVASVLSRSTRDVISINSNFYEIGGNSLNSILTISKLKEQGYIISVKDFIEAKCLRDVLENITTEKICEDFENVTYKIEMLHNEHKEDVISIITNSFYEKADLEQWLKPSIHRKVYKEFLIQIWDSLIEQNLSFIVKNVSGHSVGVSLSFDARDIPDININSMLAVILQFLEHVEGPIRDEQLPEGKGKIFESLMMGTHSSLSSKQNVSLVQFMEREVLNIAKRRNFLGVLTTNTSPLTQQLTINVFGYQLMSDIQVNKYVAPDKTRPFQNAPDSQRVFVCWKPL